MEHRIVFQDLVIGGSVQRSAPDPRKRPANILPANLPPLGLTLEEVAAFVGISPNKYKELERRKLMPRPRMMDGRRVYDRELAHAAFKLLPIKDEDRNGSSTWEDIDHAP